MPEVVARDSARADRYDGDVPSHGLRARGRGHRPAARPDRRAAVPERADSQPDRGPDGARRAAAGRRGPAARADREPAAPWPSGSCASTGWPSACWSASSGCPGKRSTSRPAGGSTSFPTAWSGGWWSCWIIRSAARTGMSFPGLAELGVPDEAAKRADVAAGEPDIAMTDLAVRRSASRSSSAGSANKSKVMPLLMLKLKNIGIQPGREVTLAASDEGVRVTGADRVGDARG